MARHYEIDGKLYPSVTTILSIIRKPYLERWRGEIGNEDADFIMEEAGGLGSEVHRIADNIAQGRGWFQFLIGRLATRPPFAAMRSVIPVSIPHR